MMQPSGGGQGDWITRWQRVARRIRVPLGFVTAGLYLFELGAAPPAPLRLAGVCCWFCRGCGCVRTLRGM